MMHRSSNNNKIMLAYNMPIYSHHLEVIQ